jgi:DtxR family manganese transport transcriptional regulator
MKERFIHFKETRIRRDFVIVEDYTRLISDLIETNGKARVCEIAREMGVSHVSVIKNIRRLIQNGYLIKNDQGIIQLTYQGTKVADFTKEKHQTIFRFLLDLGVPEQVANIDAEGAKHYVSMATLTAIQTHTLL